MNRNFNLLYRKDHHHRCHHQDNFSQSRASYRDNHRLPKIYKNQFRFHHIRLHLDIHCMDALRHCLNIHRQNCGLETIRKLTDHRDTDRKHTPTRRKMFRQ